MASSFQFSDLRTAVKDMSLTIRKQDFLTYFKKFSLLDATETTVTIGVVSSFHKDNLSKKFYDEIKDSLQKITPSIVAVDFAVDDRIEVRPEGEVIDCRALFREGEKQTKKEQVE